MIVSVSIYNACWCHCHHIADFHPGFYPLAESRIASKSIEPTIAIAFSDRNLTEFAQVLLKFRANAGYASIIDTGFHFSIILFH